MIRVLVAGSRSWKATALAARVVKRLVARYGRENLVIVHGEASGIDAAFDTAAKAAGVAVEPHPAAWDDIDAPGAVIRKDKNGRSYNANAGPRRNAEMVNSGASFVLAVHRSLKFSKGTGGCVRLALAAGIPTYLIDREDGEPKRLEQLL